MINVFYLIIKICKNNRILEKKEKLSNKLSGAKLLYCHH